MQLSPRGPVTQEEFSRCRTPATQEQMDMLFDKTEYYYDVYGTSHFCIIGIMPHALLSRDATLWVLWIKDAAPKISDYREAKEVPDILSSHHHLTFHADVELTDPDARHFAQFFGFTPMATAQGYQMYKREL